MFYQDIKLMHVTLYRCFDMLFGSWIINEFLKEILNLTWLFLWTISFPSQIVVKNNCVDTNSVPNNYHFVRSMFVRYQLSERSMHQCIHVSSVTWSHWFASELQSNTVTHTVTGFLCITYAIRNASVILERNEKRLERMRNVLRETRNEKRLERNKKRLARNETRGGNLLLSHTVCE